MDINNLAFFKAVTTKLNWLDQRQRMLADNIANADTPNYQSRDLKQISFADTFANTMNAPQAGGQSGGQLRMAKTAENHMLSNSGESSIEFATDRPKYETTPVKNGVILEEELIKVTETASNYKLMLRLYKKGADMMKSAVRTK